MNDKDMMILANLRNNARETLTSISQKTRVPISTIFDKLKMLEKDVITKHTTIIDFGKLGYSTRATITMRVDKADKEDIRDFLEKHQNINTIYKINNGFDYLIETVFRNIRELEEFLEMLESRYKLRGLQVYYIIEDIKREAFLSEPDLLAIV